MTEIRRANDADTDALRRLWDDSNREITFTPYPGAPFDPALVTDHVALVAEEDGNLVGTVYVNLSTPHFGYVFGLYVRPAARRRGVARELTRAAARAIREHGRAHMVLSVDTPNEPARRLYEQLGFEEASRMLRIEVDRLVGE